MTLSEELTWRGLVNQTTFPDLRLLDKTKLTFYHGFDASADSQAVGNLAAMMLDRCFMRHGHNAIIVAGGATSLVGDPGGKDSERELQDESTINKNVLAAEKQLKKIFSDLKFTLVNNYSWTKDVTVLDFLREVGKHFNMTGLIQRDYLANRLGPDGSGISYAEFSYTVLQGYDYLHLFDRYNCTLQLGGSDQWGNCLSGVELIRKIRGAEVHVITQPLVVNKSTGKKFGKSEEGAVWLNPAKTSPTEFYQFWLNADDESVEDYLKIYTDCDKATIDKVIADHRKDPAKRLAQNLLARESTTIVHGKEEMVKALVMTKYLSGQVHLSSIKEDELKIMRGSIPSIKLKQAESLADALVRTGLASSKTEARQFLSVGAVYVNNEVAKKDELSETDFQNGRLLLRRGKVLKNVALVEK
ncbi:MAG TPA: tyrosine--tRNA ligase [Candidatus Saccharimonadales bacterium]|nr:tyrosine--tRNA ligase [Candidatus Saccharimonadales bacterium]